MKPKAVPHSQVVSFYAGLTGLKELSCIKPLFQCMTAGGSQYQTILLNLLIAVYETKSHIVLQYVLYQISSLQHLSNGRLTLDLSDLPPYIPLTTYEVVAYFLKNMCYDGKIMVLNLSNNSNANENLQYFMRPFGKSDSIYETKKGTNTVNVML